MATLPTIKDFISTTRGISVDTGEERIEFLKTCVTADITWHTVEKADMFMPTKLRQFFILSDTGFLLHGSTNDNYAKNYEIFSWERVKQMLGGLPYFIY